MDEAAKLSEVGKFDRSNAAADKVCTLKYPVATYKDQLNYTCIP